jgi:hypothetical protein
VPGREQQRDHQRHQGPALRLQRHRRPDLDHRDDPGSSTTNGTQLQIYTCNASAAQKWTLPAAPAARSGAVTSAVGTNLCLEDRSGSTANGNPVQINTCSSGAAAQTWTVEPDGTVENQGHCLDVNNSGTTNGTLIQLYTCNNTGAQQWRATSSGQLIATESGLCLDDPNSTTTTGTQVQLYTCNNTAAQNWNLPS